MNKKHLKLTFRNSGFKEINIFHGRHKILSRFSVKRHAAHLQCVVNPQSELLVSLSSVRMLFLCTVSWCDCILLKGGDFKAFLIFPFPFILLCSLKNGIRFCFFVCVQLRTEQNTLVAINWKKTTPSKTPNLQHRDPSRSCLSPKFSVLGASWSIVCKTAYLETLVLGQHSQWPL